MVLYCTSRYAPKSGLREIRFCLLTLLANCLGVQSIQRKFYTYDLRVVPDRDVGKTKTILNIISREIILGIVELRLLVERVVQEM